MSDTDKAVMDGKENPAQPDAVAIESTEQPKAPEITSEMLTQASRRGDVRTMEEARKKLFSKPDVSRETPTPSSKKEKETEPPAPPAKRVFVTKYKGTDVERDDSDGFLEMKNSAELKKSWIHKDLTIEELEKRVKEARSFAAARERESLELKTQLEAATKPHEKPPVVEQPKPVIPPAPIVERPKVPDIQMIVDLPDDPTDWTPEQGKQFKAYQRQKAEYDLKMADYVESLRSQPSVAPVIKQEIPDDVKNALKELDIIRAERAAMEQKAVAQNYWKGVEEFQKKHKEFAFKSNPEELHAKVIAWMDKLAEGLGAPKPYQQGGPEWNNFIQKRDEYVGQYLKGDKAIIEKATGIEPPEDYDKYFRIAELERTHASLKNDKTLGPNSTLHDAYIKHLDITGQMEQGVNSLMADQFSKGADAITNVLKRSDKAAKAVPPEMAQQNFAPVADVTPTDMQWFSSFIGKPQLVMKLAPEERAKFNEIKKKLNWTT